MREEVRILLQSHQITEYRAAHPFSRNWAGDPAIIERETAADVVALGDVHGSYDRLVSLLSSAALIDSSSGGDWSWSGGDQILVCTGDLIDKGSQSLKVLDLMITLQQQAKESDGEVIVTLGNHEAAFLADPCNRKAGAFREELIKEGIDAYILQ